METIKPIQTEYNGYLFRSRLEARWAVFFDAAGVDYKYENEGYVLPDGSWYLPDFEVKAKDDEIYWFVECKGQFDEEGLHKAQMLDCYPPEPFLGVIILTNTPSPYIREKFSENFNQTEYLVCWLGIDHNTAIKAALKARQARFEHGETPS